MISISKLLLSVLLVAPSSSFVSPLPTTVRAGSQLRPKNTHITPLIVGVSKSMPNDDITPESNNIDVKTKPLPRELMPITMGVFAQMLGEGIALSSLPLYLIRLGAKPLTVGLAISCFSIAQMTFAPILVGLSSRPTIGRSIILRVCLVGAAASSLSIACATSVTGVIVGRTLAGVFAACVPVAQSGVTDILGKDQMALGLSRVSAAAQLGVVVGPALSAILQEGFGRLGLGAGRRLPAVFVVAALFTLGVLVQMTSIDRIVKKEGGSLKGGIDEGKTDNDRQPSDMTTTTIEDRPNVTRMAQPILRTITVIIGWTAILSNSIYGLFAARFMNYQQPQLSATYSLAAVLMVATQVVFPKLVATVGAHTACTIGILAVGTGIGGQSLVRIQPFHTMLYMMNRAGAAVADTATATLVASSSGGKEDRSRNLALLTSTRAAARIVTPLLSSKMFELSCKGVGQKVGIMPGALPFVTAACAVMAVSPLPSLLRRAEKRKARQSEEKKLA